MVEAFAIGGDVACRVVGEREVGEKKTLGMKLGDGVEGGIPEFERDIGRGSGGQNEGMAFHGDARGIADEGDALRGIKVGDMMGSVARGVEDAELMRANRNDFAAVERVEVVRRNR